MSHPVPSFDPSEKHNSESIHEYKNRKKTAGKNIAKVIAKKMKGVPKSHVKTGEWDGEAIHRPKTFEERNRGKF